MNRTLHLQPAPPTMWDVRRGAKRTYGAHIANSGNTGHHKHYTWADLEASMRMFTASTDAPPYSTR